MIINSATLNALRTTFSLDFNRAMKTTPDVWWSKIATKVPTSTLTNTFGWMMKPFVLREWIGARVEQNLTEHSATYTNKPYEGTVSVDRVDVETDNLGVYATITMADFGNAVSKHPDELIRAMLALNAGAGPLMWDGKNLFADDHPNYNATGNGAATTYDNNLALALSEDNYNTARLTMRGYIGEDGKVMGVKPKLLIVPPSLEKTAITIVKNATTIQKVMNVAGSEVVAAGVVDNVFTGTADILVIDELEDDPTRWYLADVSRSLKPFMFIMRKEAQFVAKDKIDDDNVFHLNKFLYGVDGAWTVGATLPWLILTSKP